MNNEVFLLSLGLIVGIFSGLLGIGGGILMLPSLVFVPPLLGIAAYNIHIATGISVVQGLVGGSSGLWTHYRKGTVLPRLVGPLASGSLLGGVAGGIISGIVSALFLYLTFAFILLFTIAITLFLPAKEENQLSNGSSRAPALSTPSISLPIGLLVGAATGFVAAITGLGGAVLILPFLIYIKGISTRIAIGTASGFVVVTSLSSFIGKFMVNLIPLYDAFWVSLGAVLGGTLGARLSHRLPAAFLKRLLLFFVVLALIRSIYEIIGLSF